MLVTILGLTLLGVQNCFGQCYALPGPDSNEERLFAQSTCGGVSNDPPYPTVFSTNETRTITKIGTYHWNQSTGSTPGTIGLRDRNGKIWGPWQAKGLDGQSGVHNVNWVAELSPAVDLPAGTDAIIDSNPSTWSYAEETENSGIASVDCAKDRHHQGNKASMCRRRNF